MDLARKRPEFPRRSPHSLKGWYRACSCANSRQSRSRCWFSARSAYGAWAGVGEGGGSPPASNATPQAERPAMSQSRPPRPRRCQAALLPLQGRWRIVSLMDGGKLGQSMPREENAKPPIGMEDAEVITIRGSMLSMPYLETGGAKKTRDYRIAVDDTRQPKTMDLIASGLPVGRGIYEFTAPATTCDSCHDAIGLALDPWPRPPGRCDWLVRTRAEEGREPEQADGSSSGDCPRGGRPTTFGGKGVIVFNLERIASKAEEEARQTETRNRANRIGPQNIRFSEIESGD